MRAFLEEQDAMAAELKAIEEAALKPAGADDMKGLGDDLEDVMD